MAAEGLYVPVEAPWYPAFRAELLSFPAGKHDDQVDALGLIGQLIDKMVRGRKPEDKNKRPPRKDWFEKMDDDAPEISWKLA